MRKLAMQMCTGAVLALLLPLAASAQTSGIAGEVKDTSGAVLPGVTVEVSSPALIEQTRSATTDGAGRYSITNLRTGTYSVTFTLPGFNTFKRDGVELTSDFTATINADMKVGAIEETITVAAESPLVDVQNITARTVMTRDVMDNIPTGRNIQAVGILIPGTSLAVGGGGALSRDVGGSGNLQQSPLQYRGSGDTVQTIEGMRLNNLCAQGAYSGVYWNDNSFQEYSYVTGADSAEMGQGGMRVNMVPKDGGNTFKGQLFGNYAGSGFTSDNCAAPGAGQFCTRTNLGGDLTYNANNKLTNVSNVEKIWDFNPYIGGPIKKDKLWFTFTFRHWGVNKTVADSFADLDPSPFKYVPNLNSPAIDDGHIVSRAGRLSFQASQKDKITWYHDWQNKYRNHWGISANVPPDASAIQVTPTNFVDVTRWTRTHTNKLLFDAGIAIYDQEYTELYQPAVTGQTAKVFDVAAIQAARVYTLCDNTTGTCAAGTGKIAGAWNNPADHFSLLKTYSGSTSYVTGSHSMKFGAAVTQGTWRLVSVYTGDVQPIEFTNGAPTAVTLRLPTDRRNGIKADVGIYAQDKWTMGRATVNLGLRYDDFIGETLPSDVLASRISTAIHFAECPDGKNNSQAGCVGTVQNWKDLSPRIGLAYDLFGDGRTAVKASFAKYVNGEQIGTANAAGNNPVSTLGLTDRRTWNDLDGNGSPFDSAGNLQLNELTASTSTPTFGKNVPTAAYEPSVLNGWNKRGYNLEYTVAVQHQLAARVSVSGGYFRRSFGNQVFTDDLRYDQSSFDGPFCVTAPGDPNLPGGGGYQVCNLYDLKSLPLTPANSLIKFSKSVGGETNVYTGFDANLEARFSSGNYMRVGVGAGGRTFDNCNLLNAGYDAISGGVLVNSERYPGDGTSYCHREYPYRPDLKLVGAYTLPFDIQLSGTYQFSRGVQTGGAGPAILGTWTLTSASFAPGGASNGVPVNSTLGRALNTAFNGGTKSVQLIREGLDYGQYNLNQLDLGLSKRVRVGRYRLRGTLDLYNVFNSSWPYTVQNGFSTASSAVWLKPTNVLQQRFFKLGASFDF